MKLIEEQTQKIDDFLKIFKLYSQSAEFKKDMEDRKDREKFFKGITKNQIKNLTELDLGGIVSNLWASHIWGNQDYLVNDIIISKNGMDKIRKEMYKLFFDNSNPEDKYQRFISQIKGLGPASITEILCILHPDKCGIWNKRARDALKILGFENDIKLDKYQINAKEYRKFNEIIASIAKKLKNYGFKNADLFFVDYYLYELQKPDKFVEKPKKIDFDHDEICDMIKEIGSWLGFESETNKPISHGAIVDVIWRTKIGNLGIVNYVFEVQSKGSIDSLILNLQKATKNKSVQKVIAVSDEQQIQKIQNEIKDLPESFRDSMSYLEVPDVTQMFENLSEVTMVIKKMDLIKSQFEFEK